LTLTVTNTQAIELLETFEVTDSAEPFSSGRFRDVVTSTAAVTNIYGVTIMTLSATGVFESWADWNNLRFLGEAVDRWGSHTSLLFWTVTITGFTSQQPESHPWVRVQFEGLWGTTWLPLDTFSISAFISYNAQTMRATTVWR